MPGTKKGVKKGWETRKNSIKLRKGDSILRICEDMGLSVKKVISLNNLKSPDDVYEGKTLRLK